jgi:starch phosphorylase
VRAQVELGGLTAEDVTVQVVYGRARDSDRLVDTHQTELEFASATGDTSTFDGTVQLSRSGSFGYNVRVVPRNPLLASAAEMGLVAVAI